MKKYFKYLYSTLIGVFAIAILIFGQFIAKATPGMEAGLGGDKSQLAPGEQFQYIVTVQNTGDTDLHNIMVAQNLSNQVNYISGTTTAEKGGTTVNVTDAWIADGVTLGTLAPAQTAFLRFSVNVSNSAVVGSQVESVVQVKSDEFPNWMQRAYTFTVVSGNQRTTLRGGNFLTVMNNTTQGPIGDSVNVVPYNVVEFFVRIVNEGQNTARNVHIQMQFSGQYATVGHHF
ncbi:MAG: hypothetical protein UX00_C0007G0143 [Microgenomates group bacterium GW2011_GWB1_45_17]|nr:MAG: hypothetical protein UX00_C0007G0143 [Microgenomates group bacterium GW2011_GWB1_45_17]